MLIKALTSSRLRFRDPDSVEQLTVTWGHCPGPQGCGGLRTWGGRAKEAGKPSQLKLGLDSEEKEEAGFKDP